ncbi:elongation factor 4 [candidate division WWE3 bacterium CG06_land_8_20_14_3_00_42_16]|uniref:Elongation factor 4 n=3 Tax=Katanobacteria TaxID=422282 RepID=A0A2M7AP77_UNCKA|nr:MAG: elongation factor 4 [candidate division WWE3 bacterium CG06_land_8_20_14_3_00_42_16]PIZ43329.1 MAG: elongation factor 4 [candidate division WWE3 bacterium CG_4_10_14_0_2_um_filter_42_8]PJC69447.1 MAG: elongation factor 4 [candidate division WWE3 bacterium CG_4_8_14_3_um_filter_42_11]
MPDSQNIRNFAIIAHIDHGKSTLADRLLEATHTIPPQAMRSQVLDNMELERERGITIKLKAVRMKYIFEEKEYELNLIDTPGHVDFAYEVSRSLAACEGVILVVDATQGIQAQTLSNYYLAAGQRLKIIPVINKIDLKNAQIEEVKKDLVVSLKFKSEEIILASAKEGIGIDEILQAIILRIPPPAGESGSPLRALIFDSSYDLHKGVVAYVRIFDGQVAAGESIFLLGSQAQTEVLEVGIFVPQMQACDSLGSGEVGYLATGLKEVAWSRVGDTVATLPQAKPLHGYQSLKPMVFLGIYPLQGDDFPLLKKALAKLKLNDASLDFAPESSQALGNGFRCGFLGLLHAEIVRERLAREYGLKLITTAPNVEYRVFLRDGSQISIQTPVEFPDPATILKVQEPWMIAEIFTPQEYIGSIMQLCEGKRTLFKNLEYLGSQVRLSYEIPLAELIIDFYDKLKSVSQGYASLDYNFLDFRDTEVVKLEILIAEEKVNALTQIVISQKAPAIGRVVVKKLKEVLPRRQFKVALQAAVGGKIIAREDIPAFRRDVLAKMSGGDYTRKRKLLEKQKKGKIRMRLIGKVDLPQEAFLAVLERE